MLDLFNAMKNPQMGKFADVLGQVDPQTLVDALQQLPCALEEVKKIRAILSNEFGAAREGYVGYDPLKNPYIDTLHVATGLTSETPLNLTSAVGKRVSRGFVQNVGEVSLKVRFALGSVSGEPNSENWTNKATLFPGQILDFSWSPEFLEVTATADGDAYLQILVQ